MSLKLIAPLAAVLAVTACTKPAPPVLQASDPRNDGIAKTCTPISADFSKPGPHAATIAMTNDGWCGVTEVDKDGKPFRLGLVPTRPAHGRVLIQTVANATRIEYTADAGYTGADSFKTTLRTMADEDVPLTVAVTVERGEGVPAAAPAATSSRPAAKPKTTRKPAAKRRTQS